MSRRPSVTIYDYPEDLNPFKDDNEEVSHKLPVNSTREKDDKKKFWTFGRNKKKRSHSFSIKSTWNGIFGKKKESYERSPTISTVSSTYQRASYNGNPVPPPRSSRDQQEFNEALGTLARRRKHTLDNSSRYSSNLTINGDPGRIYEGCPQETTASIMGDLTPKPPARRFGQVSPKPTDKIPPLDYGQKSDDREDDGTPIPPKRGGVRASQRLSLQNRDDDPVQMRNEKYTDENENMPEDFVFKRCSNDAVRKSNLSINSCMSVGSVYASGRKKRRAPLPPGKKPEPLESPKEALPDPQEIARVAEDITEMTERTKQLEEPKESPKEPSNPSPPPQAPKIVIQESEILPERPPSPRPPEERLEENPPERSSPDEDPETGLEIEFTRTPSEEPLEIIKDVSIIHDDDEDVVMRKRSSSSLPGSDSFSVKEEIEKIEKQIKLLESRKLRTRTTSFTSSLDEEASLPQLERGGSRRSLQETRRNFFRDLTRNGSDDLKIELKELPREMREIKIVRLGDSPVELTEPKEPVKVIELHISEPIKQKPEVNPVPKPKRQARGAEESEDEANSGNLI
ncbi:serine/arginine repetitive matrix protein 1-like [Diachasmimorpha longicaudata]|uniref:serine/arginine repetitive matrix protein 1-like n=1 Tax=Diachasmimorpha longicaudata TaxID=58733 RepID=UPI0030B90A1A